MNVALIYMVNNLYCSFDAPTEAMIRPATVKVVESCLIEGDIMIGIFLLGRKNISRGKYLGRILPWKNAFFPNFLRGVIMPID